MPPFGFSTAMDVTSPTSFATSFQDTPFSTVSKTVNTAVSTKYMEQLALIKELSMDKKCMLRDMKQLLQTSSVAQLINNKVNSQDWYTASTQEDLACIVTTLLKARGSNVVEELLVGSQQANALFQPIKELSSSTQSVQGVTAKTGFDGSNFFAVIKYSVTEKARTKEGLIHEIAVGLVLNTLRQYTPNFMYVYGGFLCSPPMSTMQRTAKKIEDKLELVNLNILGTGYMQSHPRLMNIMTSGLNRTLYYPKLLQAVDRINSNIKMLRPDFNQAVDKLKVELALGWGDPIPNLSHVHTLRNQLKMEIAGLKSPDVYQEIQAYDPTIDVNAVIEDVEQMIADINNYFARPGLVKTFDELVDAAQNPIKEFDQEGLCTTNDPTMVNALMMAELVQNDDRTPTLSLNSYLKNKLVSEEDMDNIFLQLVFSLAFAHRKVGFRHNDLHINNIMVHTLHNKLNLKLPYINSDGTMFNTVPISTWVVPQIIDYGFASVNYNGHMVSAKVKSGNNDAIRLLAEGMSQAVNNLTAKTGYQLMSPKMRDIANRIMFFKYDVDDYILDDIADQLYLYLTGGDVKNCDLITPGAVSMRPLPQKIYYPYHIDTTSFPKALVPGGIPMDQGLDSFANFMPLAMPMMMPPQQSAAAPRVPFDWMRMSDDLPKPPEYRASFGL